MDGLTEGRIVHYVISQMEADEINRRRKDAADIQDRLKAGTWPLGAQAHVGNTVSAGDHIPMVVVRVWNRDTGMVNGKVLLDGNDDFWATSVRFKEVGGHEKAENRTWHWIEKA